MKKHFTLFSCAIALSASVFGQQFDYYPSNEVNVDLTTNTFTEEKIIIKTTDLSGIIFEWEKIEDDIPAGWTFDMCHYGGCFGVIPPSGEMTPVSDEEMASDSDLEKGLFKMTINPNEVEGSGIVKLFLHGQGEEEGDTIIFNFVHISSLGLEKDPISAISIYPNPANNNITLNNTANQKLDYAIIDLSGKTVMKGYVVNNSKSTIDITRLTPGVYFFSSSTAKGILKTEKLVIR